MVGLQLPSTGATATGGGGGGSGGGGGGAVAPSISSGRDQFMKTLNWDGPAGDPRERGHYSRYKWTSCGLCGLAVQYQLAGNLGGGSRTGSGKEAAVSLLQDVLVAKRGGYVSRIQVFVTEVTSRCWKGMVLVEVEGGTGGAGCARRVYCTRAFNIVWLGRFFLPDGSGSFGGCSKKPPRLELQRVITSVDLKSMI